jgi:hypothetical protein
VVVILVSVLTVEKGDLEWPSGIALQMLADIFWAVDVEAPTACDDDRSGLNSGKQFACGLFGDAKLAGYFAFWN